MRLFPIVPISLIILLSLGLLIDFRLPTTTLETKIINLTSSAQISHNKKIRQANEKDTLVRGEIIETLDNTRLLLKIGQSFITLDERTALELTSLNPDETVLTLIRGRMTIASDENAKTRIQTPYHSEATFLHGTASFVRYDFLETFSVIPLNTTLSVIPRIGDGFLTALPVNIHEVDPSTVEEIAFSSTTSSVATFYTYTKESLSPFLKSREQEFIQ